MDKIPYWHKELVLCSVQTGSWCNLLRAGVGGVSVHQQPAGAEHSPSTCQWSCAPPQPHLPGGCYFNLENLQWRIKGHIFHPLKGSCFTLLCRCSEQPLQYLMLCPSAVCFALCVLGCQREPSRCPEASLGTSSPYCTSCGAELTPP